MSARRMAILVTLVAALIAAAWLSGVRAHLSLDGIRELTARCGPVGMVAFVALFAAAQLAHLPGMVFAAAAVVSWGQLLGGLIAWMGALAAGSLSFVVVRAIGSKAPDQISRPRVERLLQTLERRPIRTVMLIRLLFWLNPGVNSALALSRVRFRDYALGSAAGLALPILVLTLFLDRLLVYFSH
jgi:uncharacterized membrane protein YdjX (TVP38/TMEM64 family)